MFTPARRGRLGRTLSVYLAAALAVTVAPAASGASAGSTAAWGRRLGALNASPAAAAVRAEAAALAAFPVPAALRESTTAAPRDAAAAIAALEASLRPPTPLGDAAADAYLARGARLVASPAYRAYVAGLTALLRDPAFAEVVSQAQFRGGWWEAIGNGLIVFGTGVVMAGAVVACGASVFCAGAAIVGGTSIMVGTAAIAAGNIQDTGLAPKVTISPRGQVGYSNTRFYWQICYSPQAPDGLQIKWDTSAAGHSGTPWLTATNRCLNVSQVVTAYPGTFRIWAWVEFQGDVESDETTFRVI